MRTFLCVFIPIAMAIAGCATTSLERHTVSQSQSVSDYRYHATLHALAMVADNGSTLPSYALLSNGITSVANTGIINPASLWKGAPEVFNSEALGITGTHTPQISWTVSPVADHSQLEAMRCACLWVIVGPERAGPDCAHILADPEIDISTGSHFGVASRLARLPRGWLCIGRSCDVPANACYKEHFGDTWVWVMPSGTAGLADFTLVLQDIATLNVAPSDGSLPANRTPPLLATLWVAQSTLPNTVTVNIINTKSGIELYQVGDNNRSLHDMVVSVGQNVVWNNLTGKSLTLTSPKDLFDTGEIPPNGQSSPISFDQALFAKATGKPGAEATSIEIRCDNLPVMAALTLINDPLRAYFSPTLVFRMDRVIKPERRHDLEAAMYNGFGYHPIQPVNISWEQWCSWTTPYQGQRSSVKPGTGTTTPLPIPSSRPNRVIPPEGNVFFYGTSARPKPGIPLP